MYLNLDDVTSGVLNFLWTNISVGVIITLKWKNTKQEKYYKTHENVYKHNTFLSFLYV